MSFPGNFSINRPSLYLRDRWQAPSGYREVFQLAWPLILSSSSWTIQHFINRVFLSWHSPTAMAAAMPAGMASWTVVALFMGTASYVTTFVAQYKGAGRDERVGASVWQAIYFAIFGAVLIFFLIPVAGPLFTWVGHPLEIRTQETTFFRILCLGMGFNIFGNAISGFFSGLGRTAPVMWVNLLINAINILLDYVLIFGHWGFPSMGIEGAGWATVIAGGIGAAVFMVLFLLPSNQRKYATLRSWRFDGPLFLRLMRYGLPSGGHFMLDALAFTLFVFFVGRMGTVALGATNVAWNINTIAFMPMMGFSIAASTLVGQRLGQDRPGLASKATWSAFHMTFVYMGLAALLYFLVPSLFLWPFTLHTDPAKFAPIHAMAVIMLRFVAIYSVFDTMNLIFSSALKGAGDTRFVMLFSIVLAWPVMVLPTWYFSGLGGKGIYLAWTCMSAYVILLAFGFLFRFLQGKWRGMRVIEAAPRLESLTIYPEAPTEEV